MSDLVRRTLLRDLRVAEARVAALGEVVEDAYENSSPTAYRAAQREYDAAYEELLELENAMIEFEDRAAREYERGASVR